MASSVVRKVGAAPSGASCWICLDEGPGEGGEEDVLMRTCACRGDSGWVHTSCLASYLGSKSETLYNKSPLDSAFDQVWHTCPQCKQEFKGEQFAGLAKTRFEGIVKDGDIAKFDYRYLKAMFYKAESMTGITTETNEGKESTESLLPIWTYLDEYLNIVAELSSACPYKLGCEKNGIFLLACVLKSMVEGEEGKTDRVVARGKELLKRSKQLADKYPALKDHCDEVNMLLRKISGRGANLSEVTEYWRRKAEEGEQLYGPDHERNIAQQEHVAGCLFEEGKIVEAVEHMQRTLERSKRVMGPDHKYSKRQEESIQYFLYFGKEKMEELGLGVGKGVASLVSENPDLNGKSVQILRRAKGNEDKFVVRMDGAKVKVAASKLIFPPGTPVTIKDLVSASHLNGESAKVESFNKKKCQYVLIREDGTKVMVKPENILALI